MEYRMHITFRQLEIFKAVALCGRVTAAAEALHISQPAASMALSELEKHLGTLFDRHQGASLSLNDSGRALLPKASSLIDQAAEIEHQFSKEASYQVGELVINASSTIGNNLMPSIMGKFAEIHPSIHIDLHIDNTREIKERILGFEIDMGIVEGVCLHPDLKLDAWCSDELLVVCHPQHPLANKRAVSIKSLQKEPWVLREQGSGTREVFDEVIAPKLGVPEIKLVFNRAEAIKSAVAEGLGLGCMSKLAVWSALKAKTLAVIGVKELELKRCFYIVRHKRKYCSTVMTQFSNFVLSYKTQDV